MERSRIIPHIAWSGPQPDRETDAYLLAMLVRTHASGLDDEEDRPRDKLATPSVLTTDNLHMVAVMYAFYKDRMEECGIKDTENMLKMIKSSEDEWAVDWVPDNAAAIRKAEQELIEYVDTADNAGFRCFG